MWAFVFFGLLSVVLYRPWRQMVDRKRIRATLEGEELQDIDDKSIDEKNVGIVEVTEGSDKSPPS